MNEAAARRALVRYSHAMSNAGWVANHDGNLSARLSDDRFVCTPTAFAKLDVGLDDLLVVDAGGQRLAGAHKPFSELALHLAIYQARPEVRAVVHAHPPSATAFGAAGRSLPHPFLPEAVVSLGAEIPLVACTLPGKPAVDALKPFLRRCDAVCVAGNGVFAWGPDLETAYLRLELVEHLARIAIAAAPLGGVSKLPDAMVAELVARRAKAGLAAPDEGRPAVEHGSAADGRVPSSAADTATRAAQRALAGIPGADPALVARLAEQVAAGLTGR
ncbi:class II aldolase/adducin family protein [Myxococcota bacterium]|nr:class II aldolase/adducin family protein [Myxococcota bacterium]